MASPNRVAQLAGVTAFRSTSIYATSSPGPTGSATMSFFCVCTLRRVFRTSQYLFARSNNSTVGGWAIGITTGGVPIVFVLNSTPAAVQVLSATGFVVGQPTIIFCTYAAGTLRVWQNGVLVGTTTLGAGYTTQAVALAIGGLPGGGALAGDFHVHEAGMLDGVDLTASAVALNAQWQQDLEQGRYLTWPRAAVLNSDWYWSARDADLGMGGTALSWTDRYSASVMTRTGTPQSAAVPARFT